MTKIAIPERVSASIFIGFLRLIGQRIPRIFGFDQSAGIEIDTDTRGKLYAKP
jgi:hypothetical protein